MTAPIPIVGSTAAALVLVSWVGARPPFGHAAVRREIGACDLAAGGPTDSGNLAAVKRGEFPKLTLAGAAA